MRRSALLAAASAALLLTACGGDGDDGGDRITAPESTLAVTTTVNPLKPTVQVPSSNPTELTVTVLDEGTGDPTVAGDTVLVDYIGVRSTDGVEFDNSYDKGRPFKVTLGRREVIAGWDQGLTGVQEGARVQLDIPSDLGYPSGSGDVIRAGDGLSFVVDVRSVFRATTADDAPDIEPILSSGATEPGTEDLVTGDGAVATAGSFVLAHITTLRGDTGEAFDSTWEAGAPAELRMSPQFTLEVLVNGLDGAAAGGRRAIVVPPGMGISEATMQDMGLPVDIDVIFVVDLLAVY